MVLYEFPLAHMFVLWSCVEKTHHCSDISWYSRRVPSLSSHSFILFSLPSAVPHLLSFPSLPHLHVFLFVVICTYCSHLLCTITRVFSPSFSLSLPPRWNIHAHPYWEHSSSRSHRSECFQRLQASELTERETSGGGGRERVGGKERRGELGERDKLTVRRKEKE